MIAMKRRGVFQEGIKHDNDYYLFLKYERRTSVDTPSVAQSNWQHEPENMYKNFIKTNTICESPILAMASNGPKIWPSTSPSSPKRAWNMFGAWAEKVSSSAPFWPPVAECQTILWSPRTCGFGRWRTSKNWNSESQWMNDYLKSNDLF